MLTMDVFAGDGFSVSELTESVNIMPNRWGRLGEIGLFADRSLRTTKFDLEERNGSLQLVQSSMRGTSMPGATRGKRKLRTFSTLRFGLSDRIVADDIQNIRGFGGTTELMQVQDLVIDRQFDIRGSIDITREYQRAGAIQGVVKEADGATIVDLFTEFGIAQKAVDFVLGTATTDVPAKVREVLDHIDYNMKGDAKTGVHALCGPTFWNKLMGHDEFKEAHKYYTSLAEPLRQDTRGGVPWLGVTWEQYRASGDVPQEDGTTVSTDFIPTGDCRFFPVGTMDTFRQYNAPADYMSTVNTLGLPLYSRVFYDPKEDRYVDVEVQMNTLPICMRPAVLVRGHSSN